MKECMVLIVTKLRVFYYWGWLNITIICFSIIFKLQSGENSPRYFNLSLTIWIELVFVKGYKDFYRLHLLMYGTNDNFLLQISYY